MSGSMPAAAGRVIDPYLSNPSTATVDTPPTPVAAAPVAAKPVATAAAPAAAAPAAGGYLANLQAKRAAQQQKFADKTAARVAANAPKPVEPAPPPAPLSSIDQLGKDYEDRAFKANPQPSDNIQGNAEGGFIKAPKYGRHPAKWGFSNKPKGA